PVRINVGGGAYTSSTGQVWQADTDFAGGAKNSTTSSITGTTDPSIYQNERYGNFSYAIPVANGTYDVRLHFVETYWGTVISGSCIGKRVFSMDIANTPASPDIANLDICAEVGPNAADVKTISGINV